MRVPFAAAVASRGPLKQRDRHVHCFRTSEPVATATRWLGLAKTRIVTIIIIIILFYVETFFFFSIVPILYTPIHVLYLFRFHGRRDAVQMQYYIRTCDEHPRMNEARVET